MKRLLLICFLFSAFCFSPAAQQFMATKRNPAFQPAISAWTPNDLTAKFVWFKADSLTLNDGDAVSSWTEQFQNKVAEQTTVAAKPTYKANILNGKPAVYFDGTDYLNCGSAAAIQPITFVVVGTNLTANTYTAAIGMTNTTDFVVGILATAARWGMHAGSEKAAIYTPKEWSVAGFWINGGSSEIYSNLVSKTTGNAGTAALNGIRLGHGNTWAAWNGSIVEIIATTNAMSVDDFTRCARYLANKYGLTIE